MSGENFFILSVLHSSDVFIMSVCVLHVRFNWIILDKIRLKKQIVFYILEMYSKCLWSYILY